MTEEVQSRPLPPNGAPTAAAAGPSLVDRVDRGLEGLWHLLSSMRVAMLIMLAIAALGVVGSLVVQAPPAVLDDPAAKASFLDEVRPKYGGWTGLMDALGFFQIFSAIYFRILVAALTVSLIACSVHRIPGVWRTTTKPRVDVGPAFFQHAPRHEAIVVRHTPAETQAIVTRVLGGRRYRTLAMDDGAIHLYADRFRWAPVGGLVGHLALVVILAGAIIGGLYGFRQPGFAVSEGSTIPLAAVPGLALELIDFTDKYDPRTGAPIDYASQVVLYKDGVEIDRHTIRVNDPLRYGSTTFYQADFGPSAVLTIKDAGGATLASEGVPFTWQLTDQRRPLGILSVPGTDSVIWVLGTTGGGDNRVLPGQVEVQVFKSGEDVPLDAKVIDQGAEVAVAGLTFKFEREIQHTVLNVANDPGVIFVWLGALLLFVGFMIRFFVPHRRLWARIVARPNGGAVLGVATLTPKGTAGESEFDNLVNDIRAALLPPAQS